MKKGGKPGLEIDKDYLKSTIDYNSLKYNDGFSILECNEGGHTPKYNEAKLRYNVTDNDSFFLIAQRSLRNFLEEKGLKTIVYVYPDKNKTFEPVITGINIPNIGEEDLFRLEYRNFITNPKGLSDIVIEAKSPFAEGLLKDYYHYLSFLNGP